jgi:general stress protein YciG
MDQKVNINKSNRGFAAMDPQRQREIASAGGKAAHAQGKAHQWTSTEAREAGRKSHEGGKAHQFTSEEAREAGRKGGEASRNKIKNPKSEYFLMMLSILVLANFVIAWWLCYALGGMWVEAKAIGGIFLVSTQVVVCFSILGFTTGFISIGLILQYLTGGISDTVYNSAGVLKHFLVEVPLICAAAALVTHTWISISRQRVLLNLDEDRWNYLVTLQKRYKEIDSRKKAFISIADLVISDKWIMPIVFILLFAAMPVLAMGITATKFFLSLYSGRLPLPERALVAM